MLAERILDRLQEGWQGPPLCITVNGRHRRLGQGEPRTEVVIRNPNLLRRLGRSPSLTFGEAYMRGEIEVQGSLLDLLHSAYLTWSTIAAQGRRRLLAPLRSIPPRISPRISRHQAITNARHHYDVGNDFYRLWLDPSLTYSCAYFLRDTDDLAAAQRQKLELLCRKARLQPGQTLLDIGCGWGALLLHAAEHHGVHATGVTPALEQADHIEAEARRRGLGERVRVIRGEWRDLVGPFDRIISVGMFEHVGLKQYRAFFRHWHQLLADGGVSVLHSIGRMQPEGADPWIRRYIFPGGYLPALAQIAAHAADAGLTVLDVENLRQHYVKTLEHWSANFQAVRDRVVAMHGEPFARMWWLYLQGSQAAFRWGGLELWQAVLSKGQAVSWPLDREVRLAEWRAGQGLP